MLHLPYDGTMRRIDCDTRTRLCPPSDLEHCPSKCFYTGPPWLSISEIADPTYSLLRTYLTAQSWPVSSWSRLVRPTGKKRAASTYPGRSTRPVSFFYTSEEWVIQHFPPTEGMRPSNPRSL